MLVGREHRCGEGGVVAAGRLVGGVMMPLTALVAVDPSTVAKRLARSTTSSVKIGASALKDAAASPRIRLSPRAASVSWRSPLADSVSPTAATIALTPMIGPSMMSRVRLHPP